MRHFVVRIVIIDEAVNVFCVPSGGPKEASLSKGVLSSSPGGRLGGSTRDYRRCFRQFSSRRRPFPLHICGFFFGLARTFHAYLRWPWHYIHAPATQCMPLAPYSCPWQHIHAPGTIFKPHANGSRHPSKMGPTRDTLQVTRWPAGVSTSETIRFLK